MSVTLSRAATSPGDSASRALLLHGLGASADVWSRYVACAGEHTELWTAELPWGFTGTGDWAHDPAEPVRLVASLLAESYDVVMAHSYAANLVLAAVDELDLPRPRALVLVSPFYRARPAEFEWTTLSYYVTDFHRFLQDGIAAHGRGALDEDVLRAMAEHVRARIGPYGWTRFFDTYLRTPWLRPRRLSEPVLVVAGANDRAAPPGDAVALAAALPQGHLEMLDGCGHFAMLEQPQTFAGLVARFLAATVRPRPIGKEQSA